MVSKVCEVHQSALGQRGGLRFGQIPEKKITINNRVDLNTPHPLLFPRVLYEEYNREREAASFMLLLPAIAISLPNPVLKYNSGLL
ncbi:jg7763 [Pararge aegeria aegeria]|uniref:Jg7763 protein n=1 Tax=Pararge aegeria aegeria TaxID=348720 RepID=A0A8S4QRU9_9NEOP|nr:jg7763 [Pararge aegeria aegeria]